MWVKRMAGVEPERLNYHLQRGVVKDVFTTNDYKILNLFYVGESKWYVRARHKITDVEIEFNVTSGYLNKLTKGRAKYTYVD